MKALVDAAERALAEGGSGELVDEVADLALAACCAIASRFLAVGTPRTIGLVGAGALPRLILEAHRVYFQPRELRCTDVRIADEVGGRATTLEEACASDIVCITDPAVRVARGWIRSGTHLALCAGSVDDELLAIAKIVGDRAVCDHMWGTLAEVVAGVKDGRELDEITIFFADRVASVEVAVARSRTSTPG